MDRIIGFLEALNELWKNGTEENDGGMWKPIKFLLEVL